MGASVPMQGPPPAADAPGGGPQDALKGVVNMGMEIDQLLMSMAQTFGQQGGQEISQARMLIKQGLAKFASGMGASAPSPTSTGNSFPGGGFTPGQQ